jgi:hypothetical protein
MHADDDGVHAYVIDTAVATVVDARTERAMAQWLRSLGSYDPEEFPGTRAALDKLADAVEAGEVFCYDVPAILEDRLWDVDLPQGLVLVVNDLTGELEHTSYWVDTELLRPASWLDLLIELAKIEMAARYDWIR